MLDHLTARVQYPLAHVVEASPTKKVVTRRMRIMTADANSLNNHIHCKRSILDRDSTKVALVEFPLVKPLSEQLHFDPNINDDPKSTGLRGSSPSDIIKLASAVVH